MAERNAVKSRVCTGCETEYRCTAKELKQRIETCKGSLGSIFLPDCGMSDQLKGVIS